MESHNETTTQNSNQPKLNTNLEALLNRPEETTLEQVGGICCSRCTAIFNDRKQIDEHFAYAHKDAQIEYTCLVCSKVFSRYKTFHDHCYRHVSGRRFRCEKCSKQFYYKSYLLHMEKFHFDVSETTEAKDVYFNCKQCPKKYNNFRDLAQHQRFCRDMLACHVCNKNFTDRSLLLRHLPSHTDDRTFECEHCGGKFKTKRSLVRHQTLQHADKNYDYKCLRCHKNFPSSTKLRCHMNVHMGRKPFGCDYCHQSFTNNPNRIKHMKRLHSLKCQHPELALLKTLNLLRSNDKRDSGSEDKIEESISIDQDYIEVHGTVDMQDGPEKYRCICCPMRFLHRRSWLRHMKRNHLMYKYRCNHCDKTFTSPNPIEAYKSLPLNEFKQFSCDYCGAGFTDKGNLERHIRRAGHMKCDYRCRTCHKGFFSSARLTSHLKVHQKPKHITSVVTLKTVQKKETYKTFKCQHCDQYFAYGRSLLRHMKRKHVREMEKIKNNQKKDEKLIQMKEEEVYRKYTAMITDNWKNDSAAPKLPDTNAADVQDCKMPALQIPKMPCSIYTPFAVAVPIIQPIVIVLPSEVNATSGTGQVSASYVTKTSDTADLPLLNLNDKIKNVPEDKTQRVTEDNMSKPDIVEKEDETESELLNYLNFYIRGNNELDILSDAINVPGLPEEPNGLDTLTADLLLENGPLNVVEDYDQVKQNTNVSQPICDGIQIGGKQENVGYFENFTTRSNFKDLNITNNIQHPLKPQNVLKAVPQSCSTPPPGYLCEYTSQFLIDKDERFKSCCKRFESRRPIFDLEDDDLLPIDPRLTIIKNDRNNYVPHVTTEHGIHDTGIEELISSILNYVPDKSIIPTHNASHGDMEASLFEGMEARSCGTDAITRPADWMNMVPPNKFGKISSIKMEP